MERRSVRRGGPRRERGQERRAGTRFPLNLEVRYVVRGSSGREESGSGCTIDVSSCGLSFNADRPMSPGQALDVSIDWPALLDGGVQLQLVMSGVVVRTRGILTALRIEQHEFKTRSAGPKPSPSRS